MQLKAQFKLLSSVYTIGPFRPVAIALTCAAGFACALAACTGSGADESRPRPASVGRPVAAGRTLTTLDNNGFAVGYDRSQRRPAWVAYRLRAITGYRDLPRPSFVPDPRLARAAPTAIYAGPRYDRGHLAPNYAISQLYGAEAQNQTFYYSNIAPQRPRLNQLVWQRLEEIEIDDIAPAVGRLQVVVGPIYRGRRRAPAAFFRIWAAPAENGDGWRALAFIVPQDVRGDERLDTFIVSIDRVEALTGLDFFAALAPGTERRLERRPASPATFGFAVHACQPARYGRRWQDRGGVHLRYDRCADPGSLSGASGESKSATRSSSPSASN